MADLDPWDGTYSRGLIGFSEMGTKGLIGFSEMGTIALSGFSAMGLAVGLSAMGPVGHSPAVNHSSVFTQPWPNASSIPGMPLHCPADMGMPGTRAFSSVYPLAIHAPWHNPQLGGVELENVCLLIQRLNSKLRAHKRDQIILYLQLATWIINYKRKTRKAWLKMLENNVPLYRCRRCCGFRSRGRRFWGWVCCLGHRYANPLHPHPATGWFPFCSVHTWDHHRHRWKYYVFIFIAKQHYKNKLNHLKHICTYKEALLGSLSNSNMDSKIDRQIDRWG